VEHQIGARVRERQSNALAHPVGGPGHEHRSSSDLHTGNANRLRERERSEGLIYPTVAHGPALRPQSECPDRPAALGYIVDAFAGWEPADQRALDEATLELEAAGYAVKPSAEAERSVRRVSGLIHATDPGGLPIEIFWGSILDHEAFNSPMGRSGLGYALDRHHALGIPISMDLGKHPNDEMVSFYSRSPSGFDVEIGCGGRLIDDATWTVAEITKPSLWGHRSPK
jgi:hypothetical protein